MFPHSNNNLLRLKQEALLKLSLVLSVGLQITCQFKMQHLAAMTAGIRFHNQEVNMERYKEQELRVA
jgi:hypothetical protein